MALCTIGFQLKVRILLHLSSSTSFNELFRQFAGVSLLRLPFASDNSNGILTVSSIGSSSTLALRSRLTLIRLAWIRKPWPFGEEVSRLLYRYLYLHLLFQKLQHASMHTFNVVGMLPYQSLHPQRFHVFGTVLMPDYYPRGITRLVSCYALFK